MRKEGGPAPPDRGLAILFPRRKDSPRSVQGVRQPDRPVGEREEVGGLQAMLSQAFPTGIEPVDEELGRVIAMLQPNDAELLGKVLAKITKDSSPVADIHYLDRRRPDPGPRNETHRQQIAQGILALESKIEDRKLVQDSGWDDRMIELFDILVELDPPLGTAVISIRCSASRGTSSSSATFRPRRSMSRSTPT